MTKSRSILGVLAFAFALLFSLALAPSAHAQTARFTNSLGDGSTMAEYINLSSADQELLIHDYEVMGRPVPLGLVACSIQGQFDGGWGDGEGVGTGSAQYLGFAGVGSNGIVYDEGGTIPTTYDQYYNGGDNGSYHPFDGLIWYSME